MKTKYQIRGLAAHAALACALILLSMQTGFSQETEIQEAKRYIELDQPSKAEQIINETIATHPQDASLLYYQGYIALKNDDQEGALKSFNKGIALNEKEALNYAGKGHVEWLRKKKAEAKGEFNKAIDIGKSKNIPLLDAIAEGYLSAPGGAVDAEAILQKAKSIKEDFDTYILLGDAYLEQNNGGSAVSSYEKAATIDARRALPHYKIGLVYLRSKNLRVAKEAFQKAINVDPQYTLAYKELGELYYLEKDRPGAVKAYQQYLQLTEKPQKDQQRYAFFLFMAKDYKQANTVFETLLKKTDVSPITLRYYAYSLVEAGDLQKSQQVFEQYFKTVQQQEIGAGDYAYYGKLLSKLNQDSLAIENFKKSLSLDGDQQDILQSVAELQFKTKKYNDAINTYQALLKVRRKPLSQDYYNFGRALYYRSQYAAADTLFQKLIDLQPNMTVGYLWEARAKANLDPESENGLAKPYYEKLIEKATPEKNKSELIEAYGYLGYYYLLKNDNVSSKSYWQKVLTLNPDDPKAKEALKALK